MREDCNMKKEYMKPTMKVVKLQQHYHILVGSRRSVKSLPTAGTSGNQEGFIFDPEGLDEDDV